MKIALTTDSFVEGQGGVATAVAALARTLRNRNHNVVVYTAADPSHEQSDLDVVGLRALHYERFPGGRAPLAPISLTQELVDFSPDIIHNHSMGTMGIQALAASNLLGLPIIGTCHVFLAGFLKYAPVPLEGVPFSEDVAWRYTNTFFNRFPLVTTPSHTMQRELQSHGLRSCVATVSNGIDTNLFQPLETNQIDATRPITLVHVGRLSYEKSVDVVLRAFSQLVSPYPELLLMIVGEGPEESNLKALAAELGIAEQVEFVGFVNHTELPTIYQQADIFLTASGIETQGLVALEAMACGLPVIGARAMALPDIIQHAVNGYLITPENAQEMANFASRLIQSDELRQNMGQAARRLALEHSLSGVAETYVHLYHQMSQPTYRPFLSRITKRVDPTMAWSAFLTEGLVLKDAGAEKVWEVSQTLQYWEKQAIERFRSGWQKYR